ncbi:MAG: hypothetical protein OES32_17360 [Acidobacteriota bacterium]|nr:hypothetical protein [Acidobacteriota bacterium]
MEEPLDGEWAVIETRLPSGASLQVQSRQLGGVEKIFGKTPEFQALVPRIEGIASVLADVWNKVKPRKATVEFSLQIALESGELTALLVKGSSESNLKICLEWSDPPK